MISPKKVSNSDLPVFLDLFKIKNFNMKYLTRQRMGWNFIITYKNPIFPFIFIKISLQDFNYFKNFQDFKD